MTFAGIVEKLLPFTYIDEITQEVRYSLWSQLSDGDKIITVVEVLLLFIFFLFIIKLVLSLNKDAKQIKTLQNLLEKYKTIIKDNHKDGHLDISSQYGELREEINAQDSKLAKLWKEFDESLILKRDSEKFIVRNSIDAEYFFNKKTMISHLGSKLYSSIPGILLGIGLLGTFLGLYFALIQLNVGDVESLQSSIKVLINMAGVKFAASIWGLLLSIIFTITDKIFESDLEKRVEHIQILIDQMFIRETAEQNLDSILLQNKQQTQALNGLATSLTEKIAAEFNATLIPKIELMNQHFSVMPQQISQSINDTFQKPLEQLSNTVENLTTNQAQKSNEMLENILKEFLKELKSAAGDEGEKMKAVTTQSQDIMVATSQQLQTTFQAMQQMMQEQSILMTARDNKILDDLNRIKQDQQEIIQNLSSSVKENISSMNSEVSSSINKLVETMQATSKLQEESSFKREESISKNVNQMLSSIQSSVAQQLEDDERRNQVITTMLQQLSNQNKVLLDEINSTVSGQMNSLNSNSQQLFEKLIAQFDNHIERVKSGVDAILANLKIEVQNIDVIMSATSKSLIELPAHLEKVSKSADKLVEFSDTMERSTTKMLRFNEDFVQTHVKLDNYAQNLVIASQNLQTADANLNITLENTKNVLLEMRNSFGELAEKNSDTVDTFSTKVDKFMNDYHKHVERAIQDNIVHQLDNAFAGFAREMAEAIMTLSEAIDELREKEIK